MKALIPEQMSWKQLSPSLSELCWEDLKYPAIAARRKKYVKVYNYKGDFFIYFFSSPHMCVITKGPLIFLIKIQCQKAAYKLQ